MNTSPPLLIETCMEGGSLDEPTIRAALQGKSHSPEMKAVVSLIEWAIGSARNGSEETRGIERDEFCGASRELRKLRTLLNEYLTGT
jgi:hypothetical protein